MLSTLVHLKSWMTRLKSHACWTFCNGGLFISTPTIGSWWSQWIVLAAHHNYARSNMLVQAMTKLFGVIEGLIVTMFLLLFAGHHLMR
jgi:hypothetical protein